MLQTKSLSSFCTGWDEVVRVRLKDWKGKILSSLVCKLALVATVYNIWKHRNNVKFGNRLYTEEQILPDCGERKWEIQAIRSQWQDLWQLGYSFEFPDLGVPFDWRLILVGCGDLAFTHFVFLVVVFVSFFVLEVVDVNVVLVVFMLFVEVCFFTASLFLGCSSNIYSRVFCL